MIDDKILQAWFSAEIFPLEPALTRYLRRNWRGDSDIADLRQEIYLRVYVGVRNGLPTQAKPFLFTTARNHLINLVRRAQVVSIEHVADLEGSNAAIDLVTPYRHLTAREELRRVQEGLEKLPPRCREVVRLRRIEGLTTLEAAEKLGLSVNTIEQQMVHGMRALVDYMLGGSGRIRRGAARGGDKSGTKR